MNHTFTFALLGTLILVGTTSVSSCENESLPCGLKGSVDERIEDCATVKEGFALVTRSEKGMEVYKEIKTGLLWSQPLPYMRNHYGATISCHENLKEVAGLKEVYWRLPTMADYKKAEKSGIRKALPNMSSWFWSSDIIPTDSYKGWLFNGLSGSIENYTRTDDFVASIQCVAESRLVRQTFAD